MPQNEYIERWQQLHGERYDDGCTEKMGYEELKDFSRFDTLERSRKRTAREHERLSADAQNLRGNRAKLFQEKRRKEKIQMRKKIKVHEERNVKDAQTPGPSTPLPNYLLDRSNPTFAKALTSSIKERRNEKAARFDVPLPKVRGISEEEMFRVLKTGKKKAKAWKRLVTKPTFVGQDFTRRPVKYERFIRYLHAQFPTCRILLTSG